MFPWHSRVLPGLSSWKPVDGTGKPMALSLPSFVACPQWTLPGGFVVPVWEDVGVGAMWAETWWQERQAAQMAAWRARREQKRRVREEFAEARRFGLAARHATKLARIHAACAVTEDGTFRCAAEPTFSDWCPRNPAPVERSSDAAGPAVVGAVRPAVGRGPSSAAAAARQGSVVAARVRVAAVEGSSDVAAPAVVGAVRPVDGRGPSSAAAAARRGSVVAARVRVARAEGSSDVAGVAARVRVAPAEGSSDVAGPSARTGQPAATTAGQPAATTAGQSAVAAADPPAVAAVGSPAVAAARLAAEATRPHTAPRRPAAPIAERPTAATAKPPMVSTTRPLSAAGQRTSATAQSSAVAAQPTGTVAAGRSAPA